MIPSTPSPETDPIHDGKSRLSKLGNLDYPFRIANGFSVPAVRVLALVALLLPTGSPSLVLCESLAGSTCWRESPELGLR